MVRGAFDSKEGKGYTDRGHQTKTLCSCCCCCCCNLLWLHSAVRGVFFWTVWLTIRGNSRRSFTSPHLLLLRRFSPDLLAHARAERCLDTLVLMMNNRAAGKKVARILGFMSLFLTLLHIAVNSTCIPIIANERRCNQGPGWVFSGLFCSDHLPQTGANNSPVCVSVCICVCTLEGQHQKG